MDLKSLGINLIIDFDSTFVKLEGLEELAKISLKNNPNIVSIIETIEKITNDGMTGKISFEESLSNRIRLFTSNSSDINQLVELLKDNITNSILENNKFFLDNSDNIYIISGGFKEWIHPIVKDFGICEDHVLSNKFIFSNDGYVIDFDRNSPLTKSGGKANIIRNLKLNENTIMIGDGFTDYEVKKEGQAKLFFLFAENIHRKNLDQYADRIIYDWNSVIDHLRSYK